MRANEDVSCGRTDVADNIPAPAAEVLHLYVAAKIFQLTRDVVGSGGAAGTAGVSSFARGIRKPGDVCFEKVRRYGGEREEREEERRDK